MLIHRIKLIYTVFLKKLFPFIREELEVYYKFNVYPALTFSCKFTLFFFPTSLSVLKMLKTVSFLPSYFLIIMFYQVKQAQI